MSRFSFRQPLWIPWVCDLCDLHHSTDNLWLFIGPKINSISNHLETFLQTMQHCAVYWLAVYYTNVGVVLSQRWPLYGWARKYKEYVEEQYLLLLIFQTSRVIGTSGTFMNLTVGSNQTPETAASPTSLTTARTSKNVHYTTVFLFL